MDDRQTITDRLRGDAFARLWGETPPLATLAARRAYQKKPESRIETVTGVFPDYLRVAMRCADHRLYFSRDGIGKTKARHADVQAADLLLTQRILDGERIYQTGARRWVGFACDAAGKWWMVAWKLTGDRRRSYQTSIHRICESRLRTAKRKCARGEWKRIRRG